MNRIVEIQKRSAEYMAAFTANIVRVMEANAENTVDVNRLQMIKHKDADGKPLIHKSTGSEKLSKAYARRTGKTKPDLWVRGDFQEEMFLTMPDEKEYIISSKDYKAGYLAKNYGKIFGIAPENQPKTQAINDKLVVEDYMKQVFQTN